MATELKKLLLEVRHLALMATSLIRLRIFKTNCANLEIGSGPFKRNGWLTLDMCKGADIYWDLRKSLPIADASFNKVYCSHVLEHFTFRDLQRLLSEVHRVMRPGGEFLIVVPDASIYVDAYIGKRNTDQLMGYKPAVISACRMDILNYMFYMDGHHRIMFDEESLAFHCKAAGFSECASRSFDPNIDMAERDYESLYMTCRKQEKA